MERDNIECKDNNRGITPSISLSNVMWIMITVVSVASFIFNFDTRITVLEEQIKTVPLTTEDVGLLQTQVNHIQDKIDRLKQHLNTLQKNQNENVTEIEDVEGRIRELEYQVQDLKKRLEEM